MTEPPTPEHPTAITTGGQPMDRDTAREFERAVIWHYFYRADAPINRPSRDPIGLHEQSLIPLTYHVPTPPAALTQAPETSTYAKATLGSMKAPIDLDTTTKEAPGPTERATVLTSLQNVTQVPTDNAVDLTTPPTAIPATSSRTEAPFDLTISSPIKPAPAEHLIDLTASPTPLPSNATSEATTTPSNFTPAEYCSPHPESASDSLTLPPLAINIYNENDVAFLIENHGQALQNAGSARQRVWTADAKLRAMELERQMASTKAGLALTSSWIAAVLWWELEVLVDANAVATMLDKGGMAEPMDADAKTVRAG